MEIEQELNTGKPEPMNSSCWYIYQKSSEKADISTLLCAIQFPKAQVHSTLHIENFWLHILVQRKMKTLWTTISNLNSSPTLRSAEAYIAEVCKVDSGNEKNSNEIRSQLLQTQKTFFLQIMDKLGLQTSLNMRHQFTIITDTDLRRSRRRLAFLINRSLAFLINREPNNFLNSFEKNWHMFIMSLWNYVIP